LRGCCGAVGVFVSLRTKVSESSSLARREKRAREASAFMGWPRLGRTEVRLLSRSVAVLLLSRSAVSSWYLSLPQFSLSNHPPPYEEKTAE
jgi:hypothetical protein